MLLRNMKVSIRAALCFPVITSLVIVLGVVSLWNLHAIRTMAAEVEEHSMVRVIAADRIDATALKLMLESHRLAGQSSAASKNAVIQNIRDLRATLLIQIQGYGTFVTDDHGQQLFKLVSDGIQRLSRLADICIDYS